MPIFERMSTVMASPDAVQTAIVAAIHPVKLTARTKQGRAAARIDGQLHFFGWSSKDGRTTVLSYEIDEDPPSILTDVVDDPDAYDLVRANLRDEDYAEAEARFERVILALTDFYQPPAPKLPMPAHPPNSMRRLFIWTALFGVGGLFIAALNWRRLGYPRRFWPTLLVGITLLTLGGIVVRLAVVTLTESAVLRFLLTLPYTALVGWGLARWQRPAYQAWTDTYGVPTRKQQRMGCGFALVVFVVTLVFSFFFGGVVTVLSGGNIDNLVHRQATVSGVQVSYPGGWTRAEGADAQRLGCRTQGETECVIALSRLANSGTLVIMRQKQSSSNNLLVSVLTNIGLRMGLNSGGFALETPAAATVGGRAAAVQHADLPAKQLQADVYLVKESDQSSLMIIAASAHGFGILGSPRQEAIDIVSSLTLSDAASS